MSQEIVVVIGPEVSPEAKLLVKILPKTKLATAQKQIEKLVGLGLVRRDIVEVISLVPAYKTSMPWITKWLENGMNLERIATCLSIQRDLGGFHVRDSVEFTNWVLEELNISLSSSDLSYVYDILETLRDTIANMGGDYPAQRLRKFIEGHLENGLHEAYALASEDMWDFAMLVNSGSSWRHGSGIMPDLDEEDMGSACPSDPHYFRERT